MILEAIVEIPRLSRYKYEINKDTGDLILDRVLAIHAPQNYGFIPNTLQKDGDALDIFIISGYAVPPKTKVKVEIIGIFKCMDNKQQDDKLIGLLVGDDTNSDYINEIIDSIQYYLENYKSGFKVKSYEHLSQAKKVYKQSVKDFIVSARDKK